MHKLDSSLELGQDLINLSEDILIILDTIGFEAPYPTNQKSQQMARAIRRAFERRGVSLTTP